MESIKAYITDDVPNNIKENHKYLNLDKCLHITFYGEPLSDSRPRVTKTGGVYSPNFIRLISEFTPHYMSNELLCNTTIISPHIFDIKFFTSISTKDLNIIKKEYPKMHNLYLKDELIDIAIKDVDNMQKIYADLLFHKDFRITIEDGHCFKFKDPTKILSSNPRVELKIYYATKNNKYFDMKIKSSFRYIEYLLSYKNMNQYSRSTTEQLSHIISVTKNVLNFIKNDKYKLTKLRNIYKVLNEYPVGVLKELVSINQNDKKFNRFDVEYKLISLIILKTNNKHLLQKIKENIKLASSEVNNNDYIDFMEDLT